MSDIRAIVLQIMALTILCASFGCSPRTPEEMAQMKADSERKIEQIKAEMAKDEARHKQQMAEIDAQGMAAVERLNNGDKHAAYAMAQDFVTSHLRYPDGDFAGTAAQVKDQGNGTWFVHSYVDAKNSFNATVRTYFNANLKCLGAERWTLETLDVWEQGQPMRKVK